MKPVNTRYINVSVTLPTASNNKSISIKIKQVEFERLLEHRDEV